MQHVLKSLAVLTTIGMLFVLIGGALVTKTGSGQGCGKSWPLCNGELIPSQLSLETIIELSHRLVSGSVGILVLILSIWAWKKLGYYREVKLLSFLSLFFLIAQALLGAAAVVWGQSAAVLAFHFGISLISFASVLLLTLLIFEVDKKLNTDSLFIDKRMKFHIFGIAIYTYVVVYSGAYVRHKKASLACPDWPLCNNDKLWTIPTATQEWVQMGHRAVAGLAFLWVMYICFRVIKDYKNHKILYYSWVIAGILITLQVISGAFIVITELNLYVALLHALIISCLFGVFSYLILLSYRRESSVDYKQEKGSRVL